MDICSEVDLSDLPEEGENSEGVEWSEIRGTFSSFSGLDSEHGVNMSPEEVRSWAEHPCADKKSLDPKQVRQRVLKPLETHPRNWESEGSWRDDDPTEMGHLEIAKKASSFNARGYGSWEATEGDYKDFGDFSCPNGWAIAALNWAMDPDKRYEDFY